jgi:hypothetical protein
MKARLLLWCVSLGVVALFSTAGAKRLLSSPRPAADAGFTPDKGKLRILQQGIEAGTEEFSFAPAGNGWVMEDETTIHVPGSIEMRTSGQLRISADGTPQRYTWNAQGDKKASGVVDFENGTAKTSTTVSGAKQPVRQDFTFSSPRIAVLDNNLYEQYAILGRIYDWNTKGTQSFPVLIPQDATPGTIDVETLGTKDVDGANLELLRVHSTDLEIELYFDLKFHLIRLEVPAAKVVILRQSGSPALTKQ